MPDPFLFALWEPGAELCSAEPSSALPPRSSQRPRQRRGKTHSRQADHT